MMTKFSTLSVLKYVFQILHHYYFYYDDDYYYYCYRLWVTRDQYTLRDKIYEMYIHGSNKGKLLTLLTPVYPSVRRVPCLDCLPSLV